MWDTRILKLRNGETFPKQLKELRYYWQMNPKCRTVLVSTEWVHSKCVMKVNPARPDLCFFLNTFKSEIHLDLFFLEGSNLPFCHVMKSSQTTFVTQDVCAWPFSRSFGMLVMSPGLCCCWAPEGLSWIPPVSRAHLRSLLSLMSHICNYCLGIASLIKKHVHLWEAAISAVRFFQQVWS